MPRTEAQAAAAVERFFEFALLGLMASGFLALATAGALETPVVCWTTAGLALRALSIAGPLRLRLSSRASTIASFAYLVFFLADYFWLSRDALISLSRLAYFLAVVKLLGGQRAGNHVVVAVVAFLQLVAAALLSAGLSFMASLALFLLFAMAALTGAEMRRAVVRAGATARGGMRGFHFRLALFSAGIAAALLALTGGMFLLLPRTANAALSRLSRQGVMLGFTRQVRLGQIGELKTSSRPVLHVRFNSGAVPPDLKWRGAALADFDGRNWVNLLPSLARVPFESSRATLSRGRPEYTRHLDFRVEYDAFDDNTLFLPGVPERIEMSGPALLRDSLGNLTLEERPDRSFHFEAYSSLPGPPEGPPLMPAPLLRLEARERYLQLPPDLDPRIPQLARSTAATAATDLERARAIERHLRRNYAYSLSGSRQAPQDPLADFLFVRRAGHCEYFASAMAVMLRSVGVPTRMATGFQSGERNPYTGQWVIRASDAHSWVEAWMPGHGWTSFDPTPSAATSGAWARRANLYLDAAQTVWLEWVLGFDPTHQGLLVNRAEQGLIGAALGGYERLARLRAQWTLWRTGAMKPDWGWIAAGLAGLATVAWLAVAGLKWWAGRKRRGRAAGASPGALEATLLYGRMLRILKGKGFQKPDWFTPAEFAASLPAGELAGRVREFTTVYNAGRFGARAQSPQRLSEILRELERRP